MTWTKHGYGALGALELASIILAWIVIGVGFSAFLTEISCCMIVFIVLVILSALFTFSIVIFCFIATQTRDWDDYIGCDAKYDGLLSVWNSVDNYLYAVDSLLCSEKCKCYFNDVSSSLFVSNSTIAPYFNLWEKENKTILPKRFQDCPDVVKEQALNEYLLSNAYYNHTFRDDWFQEYYSHLEDKFKCTGFCGTTYFNGMTRTNAKIVKYLFTDYTRGIPEHFGCLTPLMDWLRKTINAFASCGIFLFVFEIVLFVLGCMMLLNKEKVEEKSKKVEEKLKANKQEEEDEAILQAQKLRKEEERLKQIEKEEEERKRKEEEDEKKKKEQQNQLMNTSYVPPESQKNEEDFRFNPSKI